MNEMNLESFERQGLDKIKLDLTEKLKGFNDAFSTSVKADNGFYGVSSIERDNGVRIDIARNEIGQISKDYYQDGKLTQNRLKVDDGLWERTRFDDNETPYLKETIKFGKESPREFFYQLAADTRISKGNFTALTDSLGRPIFNEIKDVNLREGKRQNLNVVRTNEYRIGDERGHLIADSLGGPSTAENIVAQLKEVNHGKFIDVEEIVRQLKRDNPDSKVDYSIKTNYADQSTRPSSFEPKIVIDGKEISLPKELKKIYNDVDMNKLDQAKVVVNESIEKIRPVHNSGMEMGKNAAMVTFAMSTVDNVYRFSCGGISAEEMVTDIVKETGVSGAVGYGTGFISSAVSKQMLNSGHALFNSLGNSAIPVAAITFGVESFDSVNNFAQGNITMKELCYDLGENGIGVAGSIEGAKYGAMAGTAIAGIPGAAVGGIVGGMVGYAVTTQVYVTVVETGGENVQLLTDKAQEFAKNTYKAAEEYIPEKAESIRTAMAEFADKAGMPISV